MMKKDRAKGLVAVTVLAVGILLLSWVVYDLNGDSFDLADREVRLIVTDSMDGDPRDYEISTIPRNSLVMIHNLGEEELADLDIGDVLAFNHMGGLFTHRIIAIDHENRIFISQGDNTSVSDIVPIEDARGKVVGVNHDIGMLVVLFRSNWLIIGISIILIISSIEVIAHLRSSDDVVADLDGDTSSHEDLPVVGTGKTNRKE